MNATVLEQLLKRQLGDLTADPVERGEHDGLRGVVDDEVDARQVLEGANVTALLADDASLHVVRGELHDRHRRLGGVARRHPLECVGDEVAGTAPGLGLGLLLHLANTARQLVPNSLFRARHDLGLGLAARHAGDTLELLQLLVLRALELLLKLLHVCLAVGHTLIPSLELREAPVDVLLQRAQPFLCLDRLGPAGLQLALDVGTQADGLFLDLQLRLPADCLRLAAGLGEHQLPRTTRRAEL